MSIVQRKDGWYVISKTGKNLSGALSKAGAVKRLKQVEMFKKKGK